MIDRRPGVLTERTAAIVAGACRVFLAHGYDASSMDLVAAEVGVTKKTVYNHFPSKEALFKAVTASLCDEIAGTFNEGGAASERLEEGLAHFCRTFITTLALTPGREIYRLAIGLGHRFPEFGRALSQLGVQSMQAALVDYLAQHGAAGRLRVEDPAAAAEYLLGTMLVVVHRSLCGVDVAVDSPEMECFIKGSVAAFCRAYGAPDGGGP
jgi:AcrR family transcriptional regulator